MPPNFDRVSLDSEWDTELRAGLNEYISTQEKLVTRYRTLLNQDVGLRGSSGEGRIFVSLPDAAFCSLNAHRTT